MTPRSVKVAGYCATRPARRRATTKFDLAAAARSTCCAGRDAVVHYALADTTAPTPIAELHPGPVDPDQFEPARRAELEAILAITVHLTPRRQGLLKRKRVPRVALSPRAGPDSRV